MENKTPQEAREEFVEEHTPYSDWREFVKAREEYRQGDKDEAS